MKNKTADALLCKYTNSKEEVGKAGEMLYNSNKESVFFI